MTEARDRSVSRTTGGPEAAGAEDRAWYLYGIVRNPGLFSNQSASEVLPYPEAVSADGQSIGLMPCGPLAAVVRLVLRSEYSDQAMEARLRDATALEEMVRSHNDVIGAVHQRQAILPAKLGGIYARLDDLQDALQQGEDELRAQLDRVEGCDEWAVHLYVDRKEFEKKVASDHPSIHQAREDLARATPGRAYFLQRKLAGDLAAATDGELSRLAREAFDGLKRLAEEAQVTPLPRSSSPPTEPVEVLRAAFLVSREKVDEFLRVADSFAADWTGVRSEYSGPWPPYSFAAAG
jgi:Gas vesicle synthesis protein GvpL/GvpF